MQRRNMFYCLLTLAHLLLISAVAFGQISTPQPDVAPKAKTDSVYQQLRNKSEALEAFSGQVATVNGLVLQRDAATFKFNSGEIYFLTPVEGRTLGAVFLGDVEMTLVPPTEVEKRSLALFTDAPALTERFTRLVMRFTDQTLQEVKQAPGVSMNVSGAQAARARDAYRDIQSLLRSKDVRYNIELRTLGDIYAPQRPGFFIAFPGGGRFDKLAYFLDPLGLPEITPEQVALMSFREKQIEIWTAFHSKGEYEKGTATSSQDRRLYDITRHEIDGTIRGTRIVASDRISLRALVSGTRVLPFDLYRTLRVSRVKDEEGKELSFIQESKDEDADFGVVLPQALEAGKTYKLTVEYDGEDALKDSGGGNFILLPRSTWYPNNTLTSFGDRALFEITMRYPKDYIFVATGALAGPELVEGDLKIASGPAELPNWRWPGLTTVSLKERIWPTRKRDME